MSQTLSKLAQSSDARIDQCGDLELEEAERVWFVGLARIVEERGRAKPALNVFGGNVQSRTTTAAVERHLVIGSAL